MTSNQIKQISELAKIDNRILDLENQLDKANRHRRALINNNNLNKELVWPTEEEARRQGFIELNGNTGEHYEY